MSFLSTQVSSSGITSLVLVDGSSYLFRAFHALPPLANSRGEPTGAVFGVVNMLRKLFAERSPERFAVVFDAPGPTFRDNLYPAYKANRPAMPGELVAQIEPLHDLVRAMGFPLIMMEGVEADDVIATLATQARAQGLTTVIVTGDKDFAQLVDEHITLFDTMKNVAMDRSGVIAKFGVPPERIVDYLTLMGDSVDNVPGVPGVGPKTAVKWIAEYGSLDELIKRAPEVKGKVGENLRTALPQLALARQLVTVRCDVALPVGLTDLQPQPQNPTILKNLLLRLEFRNWVGELQKSLANDAPPPINPPAPASSVPTSTTSATVGSLVPETETPPTILKRHYHTVWTLEELDTWIERLRGAKLFAFDTETTALDYTQARIVGVSFAVEAGEAAYVPLAHCDLSAPPQLNRDQVLTRLKPLLEDPNHPKLGHNLKYDMSVLANHEIRLRGIRHDSMLESYILDSTITRHDMDSLALKFLGERTIHYEDVVGKGSKQISFDQVPVERAAEYAAEDADITLRLHHQLWPRLEAEERLREVYETIEVPLIPVLSRIERHGVLIDTALLRAQSRELAVRLSELEQTCHRVAGSVFNLASPKQIQEILFERMKIPVLERTPTGQPSTAESVLEQLAPDYEFPRLLLIHRGLAKLRSTYTERLPEQVNSVTGRVHTSFHQAVAATGRLSSVDPNLQNIPVRTPEGRRIRAAFIAPPGCRLISADYSQIELRIMAHLSGDPGLVAAFAEGRDVHRATAAEVFDVSLEQVTDEQRRAAKAINFGLLYGMSAFGLARQLGIERSAAQRYVDLYFARYAGVRRFMDDIRTSARVQGFVETIYGRRLYLLEINARNRQRRDYAERTAINAPMQGSAADIIKRAMIRVDDWLATTGIAARMVLQVHDELVLEVAEAEVPTVCQQVREIMAGAAQLAVPLEVDVGVGNNWDEAH
ncbi:DNA polymerase I [Gammaproteobacteria bacterium]